MHRDSDVESDGGAKLFGEFSAQNHKNAYTNPAKNPAREIGHATAKDNPAGSKLATGGIANSCKNGHFPNRHLSRSSKKQNRLNIFATRVAAVFLTAIMAVSLGGFAGDALNMVGVAEPSAYASTVTTPYTNIDVPLTKDGSSNGGAGDSANNSDNADSGRVETADENVEDQFACNLLGPIYPAASSRTNEGALSSSKNEDESNLENHSDDDAILTEGAYAYERNKGSNGGFDDTLKLIKVNSTVGKVARIESNVTEIAPNAFTDCVELETVIVFGNVEKIAKTERDPFGNITSEGAFTDDQLKNVHIVFAVNYLDATPKSTKVNFANAASPASNDDGKSIPANEGGNADDSTGNFTNTNEQNASNEEVVEEKDGKIDYDANDVNGIAANEDGENRIESPVEAGIKRLSGDVYLSTPKAGQSANNIWSQAGFATITDAPKIGTAGGALPESTAGDSDTENPSSSDAASDFSFKLLQDYTLEATYDGGDDMPVDLALPDYGQVDGTTYSVSKQYSNSNLMRISNSEEPSPTRSVYGLEARDLYLDPSVATYSGYANPGNSGLLSYTSTSYSGFGSIHKVSVSSLSSDWMLRVDYYSREKYSSNPRLEIVMVKASDYETISERITFKPVSTSESIFTGSDLINYGLLTGFLKSILEGSENEILVGPLDDDYPLKLDSNCGRPAFDGTTECVDGKYPELNGPSRSDYYIGSWNTKADGSGTTVKQGDNSVYPFGHTLYAQWIKIPKNEVVFDHNNGTGDVTKGTYKDGEYLDPPIILYDWTWNDDKSIYAEFLGWYDAPVGGNKLNDGDRFYSATSKRLYYAQWNHSIRWYLGSGDYWGSNTSDTDEEKISWVKNGIAPTASPATPTREGYRFVGWESYVDDEIHFVAASHDAGTHQYWPRFEMLANKISFNANGGTGGQTAQVSAKKGYSMPTISTTPPTRDGYTFAGWYDTSAATGGTQYYTAEGASARSWDKDVDTTLYARWTANTYEVKFYRNDGGTRYQQGDYTFGEVFGSLPVEEDKSDISIVPDVSQGKFLGWYTQAKGGTKIEATTVFDDLGYQKLYAHWDWLVMWSRGSSSTTTGYSWYNKQLNIYDTDTVWMYAYAGELHDNRVHSILGDWVPHRPGYTFNRWVWLYGAESTHMPNAEIGPSASQRKFYPEWTPNTYTVSFDVNGGTGGPTDTVTATYGEKLPELTSEKPIRLGYKFTGWWDSPNADKSTDTKYYSLNQTPSEYFRQTSDITLYAGWELKQYTITFNINGGTGNTPKTLKATYNSDMPTMEGEMPTREGYSLAGWWDTKDATGGTKYYNADGTSARKWDKEDKTTSTRLYARWTANKYTVTFYKNYKNDDETYTKEYTYDQPYSNFPVAFSRYVWSSTGETAAEPKGWFTDRYNGDEITSDSIFQTANNDLKLYQHWDTNTLWNLTGGSYWNDDVTDKVANKYLMVPLGSTPTAAPATPTRIGYTFTGWRGYDGDNYVDGFVPSTWDNFGIAYSAKYSANTYTLYLKANGSTEHPATLSADTTTVTYDSKYSNLSSITAIREGYTLEGWYTAATGGTKISSSDTCKTASNQTLYAHWALNSYEIDLHCGSGTSSFAGGSVVGTSGWNNLFDSWVRKTYNHFDKLGALPTPTAPDGYTFVGWSDDSGLSNPNAGGYTTCPSLINDQTVVTGSKMYQAVWKFTVSYNGAGNTGGTVPAATTYYTGSYGGAFHTVSSATLTRTNYNWYGWLDSDISGTTTAPAKQTGAKTVYGNKTYYGGWSFSVKYSAANKTTGTIPSASTYYTGSSGSATHTVTTNAFTRTHYDFNGWAYTDIAGSATAPTTYSGNITVSPNDDANKCRWLYATWKFYVGYSVNNDAVAGTVPTDVTLYAGSAGSAAYTTQNPALTQRGYVFGRNSAYASEDGFINISTNPSFYVYKWNTRADSSGAFYTGGQATTITPTSANIDSTGKKITLYGQWTLINYDITYSLNNGTADNKTVYNVRTPSFTLNKPTRPGYDFSPGTDANGTYGISACGWTGNYNSIYKEGQSGYSMPRTDTLTIQQGSIGQIELTANWHLHEYQISYSLNGGSLPSLQTNRGTYNIETPTFTLVNPIMYPYSFQGWSVTGADTTNGAPIDTQGVQTRILKGTIGTLNCTAAWESFTYNITYDGNGETGGATDSGNAEYGKSWTANTNGYTKEGFTFSHWNTQANGRGTTYKEGQTTTDNLVTERGTNATLYAIWKANPYTVRFNANYPGATAAAYTQEMNCGESRELAQNRFTRTGYVFSGWSDISGEHAAKYENGQKVVDLETVSGRTHDLYAQWTPISYTVQFDSNAPTGKEVEGNTPSQVLTYDAPTGLNGNAFVIKGYRFTGWTRTSSDTGTKYADHEMIPDADRGIDNLTSRAGSVIMLYAQWTPIKYNVTYHKNSSGEISGEDLQQSAHIYDEWQTLTKLSDLNWAWTGHSFKGWFTEENLSGTRYEDGQRVQNLTNSSNGNFDLYAKWEPNVYRVTLNFMDGQISQEGYDGRWTVPGGKTAYRDISYGETYCNESGMPKVVRTGYNFDGWHTKDGSESGDWGDAIENADKVFFYGLANQTLYAKWSPIHFRIEYRKVNTNNQSTSTLLHVVEDWTYDRDIQLLAYEDTVNQYLAGEKVKDFHDANYIVTGWKLTSSSQAGAQFNCGQTVTPEQINVADSSYRDEDGRIIVPIYIAQGLGSYLLTYYPDLESAQKGINQLGEPLSKSIGDTIDFRSGFADLVNPGHELTHWYLPQVKNGNNRFKAGDRMIPVADFIGADFEHGDRIWIIPVWQKRSVRVTFDNAGGSAPISPLEVRYQEELDLFAPVFGYYTGEPQLTNCKFEGYWTGRNGQGEMLYDKEGLPTGMNLNRDEDGNVVSASWNYVPDNASDEGTIEIKLYAKWTTKVTFEYPYGGGANFTRSYILGAKYNSIENLKNEEWVEHAQDTGTAWTVGLPVADPHVEGYEFAGWYSAPQKGTRAKGDDLVKIIKNSATNQFEPQTYYGCWILDVTFDYPRVPTYSSEWRVQGQNLLSTQDGSTRIKVTQGQTYTFAGNLPTARRDGYGFIAWNEARGAVKTPEEGGTTGFGESTRVSNTGVVTHETSYTLYLEYSLGNADVLVERWVQDIGGGDSYTKVEPGASGTAGKIANGEGVVDGASSDTIHTLGTEHKLSDGEYKHDGTSADYTGFTYDHFTIESTKEGVKNTDGRVAGDGTTVMRLYYTRHTHTLTLNDFWVTNEAAADNVRGAMSSRGTYPREDIDVKLAESSSYGRLSGVETDTGSTMEVWFDQAIEVKPAADKGYAFDAWKVTDGEDARYIKLENGKSTLSGNDIQTKANIGEDAATYTFVVRDSDVFALATFKALDVAYIVDAYFEDSGNASKSGGTFTLDSTNSRGANMSDLTAKTDTMTQILRPGSNASSASGDSDASDGSNASSASGDSDASDGSNASTASSASSIALKEVSGFKIAHIEVGSGSLENSSGSIQPERLLDSTDAKDSVKENADSYANATPWIENAIVKGDGTTTVRVFYKRCAYEVDVKGSEWVDTTGASGTSAAKLGLFDDAKKAYIDAVSEDAAATDENSHGVNKYAVFYEAPVAVAAHASGHAELTAYVSNRDKINAGEHGEIYNFDSVSLLNPEQNPPADTDGLPQWNDSRYQNSMYGFTPQVMPASNVEVEVLGQPVRTSYISRYLFQDIDPTSETEAAVTYTQNRSEEMASDTSYEIEVTRTADNSRLLRYYIDGTDAQNHKLDGTDASEDAITQRGDMEVPPVGFAPSTSADAITRISPLTPDGNETVSGKKKNVVYSKYDRKIHNVEYAYEGGPNASKNQAPDGTAAPAAFESYFGASIKVAADHAVNGWEFSGWQYGGAHVGDNTDTPSITVPDEDVSIAGTWTAIPYRLTYDGGAAEATPANPMSPTKDTFGETTVDFNDEWAVTGTVPARPGYTFVGWTFATQAIFEAIASSAIDLPTGDVDAYRQRLAAQKDFDGNPLILTTGQKQLWNWWKGDRTLHAVWMRDTHKVNYQVAGSDGEHVAWPTGTTVPLEYATGEEVAIPCPQKEGHTFTGWSVECSGSDVDGDYPPVGFAANDDGTYDMTHATINAHAYGDITLKANFSISRYTVTLNPAGGRFDGELETFMGKDIVYASEDESGLFAQAAISVPYKAEIAADALMPLPSRAGYDFAGWQDQAGKPLEYPYTYTQTQDATWLATWSAKHYSVSYDFGSGYEGVSLKDASKFSEYFAGMTDQDGQTITSFMLPGASDLEGIPENVSFDGWYPKGGNPDKDLMRSFDPNTESGNKEFVAKFSVGENTYTEHFWLEVLDQTEEIEGKAYAQIGDTKFVRDDSLDVTRKTNMPNAAASMSAISGFVSVNPYNDNGDSIYPREYPYVCVFAAKQTEVNGFYTRISHALVVGGASGVDESKTTIAVSPASALVSEDNAEADVVEAAVENNKATLNASRAEVKWGASVEVGVTCPKDSGYEFISWTTDKGATPADIDVRVNPARFTMPDAEVSLVPSTELIRFTLQYIDATGKDIQGIGPETYTIKDRFALANPESVKGSTFEGWEAYAADDEGNALDPETHPVPATVGYDEAHEYMWVGAGTAVNLVFKAKYTPVTYTFAIIAPKGTTYLANGLPSGLPEVKGVEWSRVAGDFGGESAFGFEYTVEDVSAVGGVAIDLSNIKCAPYEVTGWAVEDAGGNTPERPRVEGGVCTLDKDTLGNWLLTPATEAIRYTFTLDARDMKDGYAPVDLDALKAELEGAGCAVVKGEGAQEGTLSVTFDVDSINPDPQDPICLPAIEEDTAFEGVRDHVFRGWAVEGQEQDVSSPYALPPADIAAWPKTGTAVKPVWAGKDVTTKVIAHLDGNDYEFAGNALTRIDYAANEEFYNKVYDVNDENVGYHLVWHASDDPSDENVCDLPVNFPATDALEVWGEWVENSDIIQVGFGVKWDASAPPGETKARSAYAFEAHGNGSVDNVRGAYAPNDTAEASGADDGARAHADADGEAEGGAQAYADTEGDLQACADAEGADASVANTSIGYYYIPNKGLYTKNAEGKYIRVEKIPNIADIAGSYEGWRLKGFYLPIDTEDPKRIIIGADGTVDNETLVKVAGASPTDLTFTIQWQRLSFVRIDMVGGYGEGSADKTMYYWPEKDVFIKKTEASIGNLEAAPGKEEQYSASAFNLNVMFGEFLQAGQGLPASKTDPDGTHEFIGYFGHLKNGKWDFAKDAEGAPLAAVAATSLYPGVPPTPAITESYKKLVEIDGGAPSQKAEVYMPYGYNAAYAYDEAAPDRLGYDPASADGTTGVTWRAAWEGDLDEVYFNATVPMSMSFMIRADGTVFGPDAGAYRIRNYSNAAITVEDMSMSWSEDGLASLFGEGGTDAITLTAKPTEGQAYTNAVTLSKQSATEGAGDGGTTELVSKYVFSDADKWVIAKSVGIDPDDFELAGGDASTLPTLRLDYDLSTGGIKPITFEGGQTDTAHPIGTLRFTLKAAR